MTVLFSQRRRVIPAAEFGLVSDAAELLAAAQRTAEASAEKADAAQEEARREGFAEGYAEGLRNATETLAAATETARKELLDLENWILPVVLKAVDIIVGSMEPDERVRRIVARAIADVADVQSITLRVPPEDVPLTRRAIGEPARPITIVTDATLAAGEIVMETSAGRAHIGIGEQIAALVEQTSRD